MGSFQQTLRENYLAAKNQDISDQIWTLSQENFISGFDSTSTWAIGPFTLNPTMTFTKERQLGDPTDIGWSSSSIFNPTIIEEAGKLYLFYRAAVKKESLGSRIGLAIFEPGVGWNSWDEKPIIFPTEPNEILSVEDPKVYRVDNGTFVMFYNGVWRATPQEIEHYQKPFGDIACDIKMAVSNDLINWDKCGLVVPYDISHLWAKGAVIPRDYAGNAVRIAGEYWMFLSEGCGGKQYIGKSTDMSSWLFEQRTYLELPEKLGNHIYEVATAIVDEDRLVLDFMYSSHDGQHRGAQALYELSNPTQALAFTTSATLAWGGMIQYRGRWCFAQGWDAQPGKEQILFYIN